MSLSQDIKRKTIELGFDLVGITSASPIGAEHSHILTEWLKSGFAGRMAYMHRNLQKRLNPAELLEHAQSVIVVGLNYSPAKCEPKPVYKVGRRGRIVTYAQYEDYHSFIKARLRKLIDFINTISGGYNFKICVDSAPVAERALAARASLGFIGKNHILINPELGCRIFLGEIITDLKLQPDEPYRCVGCATCCTREFNPRGQNGICPPYGCNKCVEACPTGALRSDGQFHASRCINYLTIEHKGPIPPDLSGRVGDRLFGCEECILACPYQETVPACANTEFKFYPNRAQLNLQSILDLSHESFEVEFTDSPIKRVGLDGLKRNARICLANKTMDDGR